MGLVTQIENLRSCSKRSNRRGARWPPEARSSCIRRASRLQQASASRRLASCLKRCGCSTAATSFFACRLPRAALCCDRTWCVVGGCGSGLGKNARRHMATCCPDPCGELLAGKKCTSRSISGPQQHAYVILEYKHSLLQNTSKIHPKNTGTKER